MKGQYTYIAIDMKSFYASVECVARGYDPLRARLLVVDVSRSDQTICLAVSPALKDMGVPSRPRLFEAKQAIQRYERLHHCTVSYVAAVPRMALYEEVAAQIHSVLLGYAAAEDIHVYSIDECFIDVTPYLHFYREEAERMRQHPAHVMAMKMVREILKVTGITATVGIGTNLYLAKIAMDIVAKHVDDHIGILNEISYRQQLWDHSPLSDFWRIGSRTEKKLAGYGIHTMGDIAYTSVTSEEWLYKMFGIDAELLIDHAWGLESCDIHDIKNYHTEEHSLSNGQVLMRNYSFEEAAVVVREMTDVLVLDLVSKGLITGSVTLWIAYDHRYERPSSHGTVRLTSLTNSSSTIMDEVDKLYQKITDRHTGIRRIEICANRVMPEGYLQYDLFTDPAAVEKEKNLQQAILDVKKRYGKNAIMRGANLLDCSTYRERNNQIGGHRA